MSEQNPTRRTLAEIAARIRLRARAISDDFHLNATEFVKDADEVEAWGRTYNALSDAYKFDRACVSCQYADVHSTKEPCLTCMSFDWGKNHRPKWEPRT